MLNKLHKLIVLQILVGLSLAAAPALGQDNDFGFGSPPGQQDPLNQDPLKQDPLKQGDLLDPFSQFQSTDEAAADFEARFTVKKGQKSGTLLITGKPNILSGSHLYSQRTDLKNQTPTEFDVLTNDAITSVGGFVPDVEPEYKEKTINGEVWQSEEYSNDVTWSAPIEFSDDADVEKLEIKIRIDGQVCNENGCLPLGITEVASFGGYVSAGPYRVKKRTGSNKVEWLGKFSSKVVKPGDKFKVDFQAKLDEQWHIYGLQTPVKGDPSSPTIILFSKTGDLEPGEVVASKEANVKQLGEFTQYHLEGDVTLSTEIQVPDDAEPGDVQVSGKLGFQTCDENGLCKNASVLDFSFTVSVGSETDEKSHEITLRESQSDYKSLQELAVSVQRQKNKKEATNAKEPFDLGKFLWYCGAAFLAGLILNVMPCVLPVIGLKMMSFVEQSGENRGRIFALNISFSLGLMTVFWFLAVLVIFMNFGWGDLLNDGIKGVVITSAIVFAFGLSMIGVWEIPIPGFASSSTASSLAEKEGLGGAYIKGILTTILATPCVGPMLIPAMTFAVTQSNLVAFAIFTVLGLGMASPFVMVAIFPGAIKLLPKPGAWMETFKQVMGFILIATVIFLMNTFSQKGDQVAWLMSVLTMLLSVAVGCWWIGRTSIAAEFKQKLAAYTVGTLIIAGGSFAAFEYLGPREFELEWKMYSDTTLAQSRKSGAPILIDFTGPG